MPDRKISLPLQLTLLAALLCANAALADTDRWFRVEMMVFAHAGGDHAETWDATPKLVYPNAARFLVDPDRVRKMRTLYNASSSIVDEYGRQTLTLGPIVASSDEFAEDTLAASLPSPFVTLPSSAMEFRGKAAYMQRSGRYRMLFHESWVQPVAGEAAALPIIVDHSGDDETWPTLQGSIKLYLSRYLHLETNLWLNTDGQYLNSAWRMPAPPLGPPSVIIESPMAMDLPMPEAKVIAEDIAIVDTFAEDETAIPLEELESAYPFRHAVTLQQKRRMRSMEVHYIDHPMLGLVIKITPLAEEDLESMAQIEPRG